MFPHYLLCVKDFWEHNPNSENLGGVSARTLKHIGLECEALERKLI
jgi:hypothetical protein